jgi:hypothetical protein
MMIVPNLSTEDLHPFPQLAIVAADPAARDAFTGAVDAAVAAGFGDGFINRSMYDYQMLMKLGLGSYPDAGESNDHSPAGWLGKREAAVAPFEASTILLRAGSARRCP